MGLFQSLAGRVRIRITSADISEILLRINENNIPLFYLEETDDFTVTCLIGRRDYSTVKKLVKASGNKIETLHRQGLYWSIKSVLRRPVLAVGILIFFALAIYLPSRILFVKVEGNRMIPTRLILAQAEESGIRFGASRRQIRSEKVKNALIERIPELQWVGVNTSGCVATIRVAEKTVTDQDEAPPSAVSNIVASRDGVIWECTVTKGTSMCQVGQAVKAGQTLVSGYTDCGIAIKATRAEAEIYARTLHDMNVTTPKIESKRGKETGRHTKYSLIIGKNMLKLFNSSGISGVDCVKMYEEKHLTLPGGFQLPIGIATETWIYYDSGEQEAASAESYDWLKSTANVYLESQMVAGTILNNNVRITMDDNVCRLRGQYACLEMIGQVKYEEKIQK